MLFWKKEASSKVFGVTFEDSLSTANSQINFAHGGGEPGRIPVVVAKCGHYLKSHALDTPGVFRVAGNNKRIRELQEVFDSPPYGRDFDEWSGYSVHDVASLLKRFLTSIKDSDALIPAELSDVFEHILTEHPDVLMYLRSNSVSIESEGLIEEPQQEHNDEHKVEPLVGINQVVIEYKMTILSGLDADRKYMFMYLLDLLGLFASNSDVNLMTASNLAAIFQPAILGHARVFEKKEDRLILEFMIRYSDKLLELLCTSDAPIFRPSAESDISPLSQSPPTPASTISSNRNNYFFAAPQTETKTPMPTPTSSAAIPIPRIEPSLSDKKIEPSLDNVDQYKRRSSLPWLYKLRNKV